MAEMGDFDAGGLGVTLSAGVFLVFIGRDGYTRGIACLYSLLPPGEIILNSRGIRWGRCLALVLVIYWAPGLVMPVAWSYPPEKPDLPAPAFQSLRIEPEQILLNGGNRQQQLLITATGQDGLLRDVTHQCEIVCSNSAVVQVAGSLTRGRTDGTAEITARLGKLTTKASVRVRDIGQFPPVHFANDMVPLFSKLGCNSGGCHGKASGQNGFKLSVFGFDPAADHDALVKEARGRRVLPGAPEFSLLLLKPTGKVAHGGGRRLEVGSIDYQVFHEWLKQGMPLGEAKAPGLTGLRVSPKERILGLKAEQQILATAVYADGSLRDVTLAAGYASNAGQVAEVDGRGRIQAGEIPGEAAITVHYMGQIAAVRIVIPRPNPPNPYPPLLANNRIDELVWAKLKTMGMVPSELANDAMFLRRTYLALLGTLPSAEEARAFLADQSADKRGRWIDKILDRPEYSDYWAQQWADLLLVNRDKLGDRGAFEMHRWLRGKMAANQPLDQWVRELVTARGSSARIGPVNFFRAANTPEEATRAVSQAFLGIRLECAQCHHHPFEKWGQEDFFGLAGYFNGLERKKSRGEEEVLFHAGYQPLTMPGTNNLVAARPPGGPRLPEKWEGDPRTHLADWITRPDNPHFARLAVNRLWKHYLGRGLVEPEDDLRSTNPATNEPLLDYLAKTLIEKKYDLKAVTRLILNSRVYQLSSVPLAANKDDAQHYAHYRVKRMPAEVLLDALSAVTESPELFPGRARGTRAIELWDNRLPSYFLDIFGRSERLSPCSCGRASEPTMAQCLHLMNAPEIEKKLADPGGRIARLLKAKMSEARIVEELCLAALGRFPEEKELRVARELFRDSTPAEAAQDFLWTLLNAREFLFIR